jgi:hypothetical protein
MPPKSMSTLAGTDAPIDGGAMSYAAGIALGPLEEAISRTIVS